METLVGYEGDWCSCGLATNDPLHEGFHSLKEWNDMARRVARERAMKEFDRRIAKPKTKGKRRGK